MSRLVTQSRFITEALEAHNRYRAIHGCPPLESDDKLNQMAAEWAEHLALKDKLEYRNIDFRNEPLGENVLRANCVYFGGDAVTDEWYGEGESYPYDGKFLPSAGHFTQIIWKNTRKVGFGFALTENGRFYAVANYHPAGNFKGEFETCVPPPQSGSIKTTFKITKTTTTFDNGTPKTTTTTTTKSYMPINRSAPAPESSYSSSAASPPAIKSDPPKSSSSSASSASGSTSQFVNEALTAHNNYRKKHGVDPLRHNSELSKIAQKYAEYLASIGQMKHSTNTYEGQKLGENLAFFFDSRMNHYPGEKAVEQWYSEIKDYRYRDYQPGTGHFTQVVWKGSKEVGLGVARAKDGSFYAVANYLPAGNLLGSFSENVPRPIY